MEAARKGSRRYLCIRWAVVLVVNAFIAHTTVAQLASHVVISEIYGGGGNSGAKYKNDYIELYNPTASAVTMTNWSVQYAAAAGSFTANNRTIFSGTIAAHGFFLIQEAAGSNDTTSLPTPDAIDSIKMSATSGKIALVRDTVTIGGPADITVVDFVGYGSANAYEGTGAVPTLSSTTCAERKARATSTIASMALGGTDSLKGNGWDSQSNDSDFVKRNVQGPQNSSSALEDTASGTLVTTPYTVKAGWNMISVPLAVENFSSAALYPSASSPAFSYEGSYFVKDTLANATGYWMRFPADTAITLTGYTHGSGIVPVVDGWNLIGTLSSDVAVATVTSNPPGIIVSNFFGFTTAYAVTDVLAPSKGYWVKVNGAGSLTMISNAGAEMVAQGTATYSHLHSLTFIDGAQHERTLYFGRQRAVPAGSITSELPPRPPAGLFDVRFASQRFTETYDDRNHSPVHYKILLEASAYPVTLRWDVGESRGEKYFVSTGSQSIQDISSGSGLMTISDRSVEHVNLDIIIETNAPTEHSLSPCYPNPFNPTTRFTISIPRDEAVHVEIYDLLGRLVKRILDGPVPAGRHVLEWDGHGEDEQTMPGGMYFVRLSSGSFTQIGKVLFMK
ncbi:MAG: lamin tail domain-containing protein [Ignavibacteriae bacterium]|nr:lamin tail domain-containing protein [Ignavibacteria bacterium]MBI3365773.1 lamin tail domain-containing protein [Ignavibacteriota bacterium]